MHASFKFFLHALRHITHHLRPDFGLRQFTLCATLSATAVKPTPSLSSESMVYATRFTYGTNHSHSVGCFSLICYSTRVRMKVLPEPVGLCSRQGVPGLFCNARHRLEMIVV